MPVEASMMGCVMQVMNVLILLQSRVRNCWQATTTLHCLQSRMNTLKAATTHPGFQSSVTQCFHYLSTKTSLDPSVVQESRK